MKRKLFALIIFWHLVATVVASAEIQVKKSAFTPVNSSLTVFRTEVALNTKTGLSLVVWSRSFPPAGTPPIVGRIVDAKGKAAGKPFTLVSDPSACGLSVAYNPNTNEFLLAYDNNNCNASLSVSSIFVMRLSERGRPLGSPINISTDPLVKPYQNVGPKAVFNPKTGGYTVLWFVHGDPAVLNDSFHAGVLVSTSGSQDGPVTTILSGVKANFAWMDSVYLPSGNKLLVLFRELNEQRTEFNFWLAALDPLLKNINPSTVSYARVNKKPFVLKTGRDLFTARGTLSFISDVEGMVFYNDNTNLKARKMNHQGKLSGPPFVAFNSPKKNTELFFPSVAFTKTSIGVRGILIATEDRDPSGARATWAQVLDEKGKPSGTPVEVNVLSDTEIIQGGAISALLSEPANIVYGFLWYGTFARPANTGIVKFLLKLAIL